MFLRKDATKHLVIRDDELIRKTTIYAKIAYINWNGSVFTSEGKISTI
ncbi:hypothetical protein [Neobacillus drentensis]